jgi:hypothetical protein
MLAPADRDARSGGSGCSLRRIRMLAPADQDARSGGSGCSLRRIRMLAPADRDARSGGSGCSLRGIRVLAPADQDARSGGSGCSLRRIRALAPADQDARSGGSGCSLRPAGIRTMVQVRGACPRGGTGGLCFRQKKITSFPPRQRSPSSRRHARPPPAPGQDRPLFSPKDHLTCAGRPADSPSATRCRPAARGKDWPRGQCPNRPSGRWPGPGPVLYSFGEGEGIHRRGPRRVAAALAGTMSDGLRATPGRWPSKRSGPGRGVREDASWRGCTRGQVVRRARTVADVCFCIRRGRTLPAERRCAGRAAMRRQNGDAPAERRRAGPCAAHPPVTRGRRGPGTPGEDGEPRGAM